MSPARHKPKFLSTGALRFSVVVLWPLIGGCSESESTIDELISQMESSDRIQRYEAAEALGNLGQPAWKAGPSLAEALEDRDPLVRIGAAYALAKIGPDAAAAIPALTKALDDPDRKVQLGALYALPAMGSLARTALPTIRGCLNDPDEEIRNEAKRAIERIRLTIEYQDITNAVATGSD